MLLRHVGLVSKTSKIKFAELAKVAAALQKQATRDLGPIWDVMATVDPFELIEDVPVGYWPIIIKDDIHSDVDGYHEDERHQPFALVQYADDWALTSSHEILEMLVDPYGYRMQPSDSLKPEQGRVQYLIEVCDPSEDFKYA